MGTNVENDWDEEYSVIGEKGEVGFLDFEDEKSLHSFDTNEEDPIVISYPFPFVNGLPQSVLLEETAADSINIKNTTSHPIDLWSVRIYSSNHEDSFLLSLMKPPSSDADEGADGFVGSTSLEDRTLQPGQTLTIWISCKPKVIGMHNSVVHFDVGEKIERVVFLLAEDKVSQDLFSSKPYSRTRSQEKKFNCSKYVSGSRPSRPSRPTTRWHRFKLPQYPIPPDIREVVENKQLPDVIMEGLHNRNYRKYFSTLIVLEEIRLEEDMRSFDMVSVTMTRRRNNFLSLEVPGLAERRPSLVYGDFIFVHCANDDQTFQGYIHRVEADEIFLRFDQCLHVRHRDDDLYDVSFTYNRLNMRRQYQAVEAAENLGRELLFPSQVPRRRVIRTIGLNPLSRNLNREQARSVEKILGCKGAPPYVIHGPPGTGKTMTLVEAMLQLYISRRKARILVCASSNSASDHILEKLIGMEGTGVRENEIFRLNALSRPYEDIKTDLLRFCFYDEMEMVFKCPPLNALLQYKIIISTYMSASMLYSEGIKMGHFSHIFLDEAGQASEPETMVPISNLCARDTVIVLAGDPMQLGPVIYSKNADDYGLGKSYLERLFEFECYERGDENYVTKLVRNYRCHPAILELPSNLFYRGELIACKKDDESCNYDCLELPNMSFPVLFIGIEGVDEREGNNPSWFNRTEVSKVLETINKLMNGDVDEADIGVITPYRQQVNKLKKVLESLELSDVKVGTVEQFQGQERLVIIISTVRSTFKHNEFDRTHNLGFLSNPRRFNVAVTRAKSLLVIIGNPHIISKDPYWDKLLRYCVDNGSYQGCSLPPPGRHFSPNQGIYYGEDDVPDQYSSEVPKQYSNEVERDETGCYQYSDGALWRDEVEKQYSNNEFPEYKEMEGGEETPIPYQDEIENASLPCSTHNPYTEGIKWGDITITPSGWDD